MGECGCGLPYARKQTEASGHQRAPGPDADALERPREPDRERFHDYVFPVVAAGDFVKVGDVEGTYHLGVLSTKVRTPWNEDVLSECVVVAQTTTDYSRFGDTDDVFTPRRSRLVTTRHGGRCTRYCCRRRAAAGLRPEPKPSYQASLELYVSTLLCASTAGDAAVHTERACTRTSGPFQQHGADHVAELRLRSGRAESGTEKDWSRHRPRRADAARVVTILLDYSGASRRTPRLSPL